MEVIITFDDIKPLIDLLDDPDDEVFNAVRDRFQEVGPRCVPILQEAMHSMDGSLQRQRAIDIIHGFQTHSLESLTKLLKHHLTTGTQVDLEEAMFILDEFGNPGSDRAEIAPYLDGLALRVHELFITQTPANDLTHVLSLTTVLYDEEEYHGAAGDFYNPENSYLSSVVSRKAGIPISLAALVLLVADRIGLSIEGVSMPYHFLLSITSLELMIDPFNAGTFITADDCKRFISKSGIDFRPEMLDTVGSNDIIVRMMRNLVLAHEKHSDVWEAQQLNSALSNLGPSPTTT